MNYLTLIHHLQSVASVASKAYALGSEIISITAILWCLNMFASMIEKTYTAGYAVGKFYRQHCHQYVKLIVVHAIALTVLLLQLFWEGCIWTYQNRKMIAKKINTTRNSIGSYFVYQ